METAHTIEDIIAGCKKGHLQYQKALYQYCYTDMMKICLRYTKDRNEAAALYNASMLKVFNNIHTYQNRDKLLPWIRTLVINTCIDNARTNAAFASSPLNEGHNETGITEAEAPSNISAKEILAIIRELPLNLRTVFNLFAIEGYSHEEISQALAIPVGTSKWYVSEARRLLKNKLEKQLTPEKI